MSPCTTFEENQIFRHVIKFKIVVKKIWPSHNKALNVLEYCTVFNKKFLVKSAWSSKIIAEYE